MRRCFRLVGGSGGAWHAPIWCSGMSDNEHVRHLVAAREQAVQLRRYLAEGLSKPFKRASSEQRLVEQRMEQLVVIQRTINAIDEAIADERTVVCQGALPAMVAD